MKVYLSIVLGYSDNVIMEPLYETSSLMLMDDYIKQFNNSNDIRKAYAPLIEEFLLDKLKPIEDKKKQNNEKFKNSKGQIMICFYGKGKVLRFVPVIYNNNNLLKVSSCIRKIKSSLEDNKVLEEIYNRKKYLLSQFEIDSLKYFFKSKETNDKYKKDFIESFIYRLKEMDYEKRYYFFRTLTNLCDLVQKSIKTSKGKISKVNIPKDGIILKRNNIYEEKCDPYLLDLIDKGDYETIFKYYDLDYLDSISRDRENIIGSRSK